jgi:hypothetical protein
MLRGVDRSGFVIWSDKGALYWDSRNVVELLLTSFGEIRRRSDTVVSSYATIVEGTGWVQGKNVSPPIPMVPGIQIIDQHGQSPLVLQDSAILG